VNKPLLRFTTAYKVRFSASFPLPWADHEGVEEMMNVERNPPPQPTRGLGDSRKLPPAGSGTDPRPKLNFVKSECQRNHLVARILLNYFLQQFNSWQFSCLHLCVRRRVYICIYLCLYVYICLYVFMCMCTCVCMCVCLCVFSLPFIGEIKLI